MAEMTFEQAVRELDEIAAKMNSADTGIEEMMALYKRGMTLCAQCQAKLDGYEKQIRTISDDVGEQRND